MFDRTSAVDRSLTNINVIGLGDVPNAKIHYSTDSINYEKVAETNNHNETGVTVTRGYGDLFNDKTDVTVSCDPKFCTVDVAINSEVGIPLYNDGSLHLKFDRAQKTWSMTGVQSRQSQAWQFCSPDVVLNHVTSILTAMQKNEKVAVEVNSASWYLQGTYDNLLLALVNSITFGKSQLIASASQFVGASDCSAPPLSSSEVDPRDRSVLVD